MQAYVDNMQTGPIMFSASNTKQPSLKSRKNSSNSLAMGSSVPGNSLSCHLKNIKIKVFFLSDAMSMPRVASVTTMLKRFFSRDDSKNDSRGETNVESNEMSNLMSNEDKLKKIGNSVKRLTDDVIEEVDEQTTITSQKSLNEPRPTVMNLFDQPPRSKPIDVPHASSSFSNE